MAAQTIHSGRLVTEQRFHAGFRMAGGANHVIAGGRESSVGREAMAERAICPESSASIDPRVGIHMFRVGKIRHNRSDVLIAREWQQIVTARRRKGRMTLSADLLFDLFIKIVGVTRHALVMSRPLQNHGTLFLGYVAGVTLETNLFRMVFVQVKRLLRLFLGVGRGGGRTLGRLPAISLQRCI